MKSKNTIVLLDYDGTVSQSLTVMRETYNHYCRDYGLSPRPTNREFAALFDNDSSNTLLNEAKDPERLKEFLGVMSPAISDAYKNIALVPGMEAILKKYNESPNLIIVTSNFSQATISHLRQNGIIWNGERIIGMEGKTPKEIYLSELKAQNANKDIFIISDTKGDIRAGKKANVLTGAVSWGYCSIDELKAENPDYTFESPKSLEIMLKSVL